MRIVNSEIMFCEHGVVLSSGTDREIAADNLQPADYVLRSSHLLYNTDGLILIGLNDNKHFYVTSSNISFNSNGLKFENWADTEGYIETHLYLSDSHVERNRIGILDDTFAVRSDVTIERSTFIGQTVNAYELHRYSFIDDNYAQLAVRDSHFIENSRETFDLRCNNCFTSSWSFYNNRFVSNGREAISATHNSQENDDQQYLNLTIVNNTFQDSSSRYYSAMSINTASMDDRVTCQNNTFDTLEGAIEFRGHESTNFSVVGNTFRNMGQRRVVIEIERAAAYIGGNTFQQCTAPTLIYLHDRNDHVITENKFINNTMSSCLIEVHPDNPYDRFNSIQANRNYWDTQDVHRIKDIICDFFLNSNRARVEMTEFYTSPDMSTTVNHPDADNIRSEFRPDLNAVVIGGVITSSGNTSLAAGYGYKLLVNRSIIVEPGASVDLYSVTVEFAENRGVIVYGNNEKFCGTRSCEYVIECNALMNTVVAMTLGICQGCVFAVAMLCTER